MFFEELFNHLRVVPVSDTVSESLRQEADLFRFKGEVLAAMTDDVNEEFSLCRRELEKESIKERLLKLGAEIEAREREGNGLAVTALLNDFRNLSEKLKLFS